MATRTVAIDDERFVNHIDRVNGNRQSASGVLVIESDVMDVSSGNSERVSLLSRLTGIDLSQEDLSPITLFLAALATILSGVIVMDGAATEAEKQHLKTIVKAFVPSDSYSYQLMRQVITGVRQSKTYLDPQALLTLTANFATSENLLLVGLGYHMAAIDQPLNEREALYLRGIAQRLNLAPSHLAVFEAIFDQQTPDPAALSEVKTYLDAERMRSLNSLYGGGATLLRTALSSTIETDP